MTRRWLARPSLFAATALAAVIGTGCAVGRNYSRPEVPAPPNHRGLEGTAVAESLADVPWWQLFDDPALQGLIRESIANNYDLRAASARVMEARAQAGIAKSFLFPQIGFSGGYVGQQVSRLSDPAQAGPDDKTFQNWNLGFSLSWELDLFGRIRREKESAFAQYLGSEQGRRGVLMTLVADVASDYFQLRELDLELEIARRTLTLNEETVTFYSNRLRGGVSNRLEVDQAQANRALTASTIPDIERQIALTENALSVLLGRFPGPIPRGSVLTEQHFPPTVPAGIPATLLERRPDVAQAEDSLISANADVGAAKALFFPTINLTGLLGGVSHDLSNIVKSDGTVWSLGGGLFQPLFQGGRIKRNYEAAMARFDQALAQYQMAALAGYREVADSLVTIEKLRAVREEQEKGVVALRDATQLARSRYDNGLSSYLEILIADQSLFQEELQVARTRGAEFVALAQLYRALGGGWQQESVAAAPAGSTSP
ncbi:MAG: efflux transporter outer membrane subunit [Vicinamibacteria bacterium]